MSHLNDQINFKMQIEKWHCTWSGLLIVAYDLDLLLALPFLSENSKAQLLVRAYNEMSVYLKGIHSEKIPRIGRFFYRSSCNQTR